MREEEKQRTSQNAKLQQFFRKRWVFPAIYLTSAAVILTAVLWYQSISNNVAEDLGAPNQGEEVIQDPEAVEVNATLNESFTIPAIDPDAVTVVKKFYDPNASAEEQEAALVFYNNTYRMNKGIDIAREDQKEFEVVASLSGTVTKAEKDPILGTVVEIEHENDVVTVYQSLAEANVQAGDKVEQNQIIGVAGKNLYNEEDGVHVHFEIRQNGTAINPLNFFGKPVTSIEESAQEETKEDNEKSEQAPKENTDSKEETPETDKKDTEKGTSEDSESNKPQSNEPEASNNSTNS